MENLSGHDIKGYELRERIGAGGFGAVYKAHQTTVGREVAVKIILPGLASHPDFIRRFETEAQLIARLEHPHITPLYDYWRDPDGAYLVMRFLRGGSVRDALQNAAFDVFSASLLMEQVAGALSLAHRNKVIHRDLKPGNILLDEDSNAYLADFGIAKDLTNLRGDHTSPDAIIGSLDYISPEQARSEPVTPRTDIYSLGVVLFELLAGHHPFQNTSSVERLYKHINDPLPEVTNLDSSVHNEINRVIQRATAKNPDQRYADAVAFAADFREAAGLNRTPNSQSVVESLTPREQEILRLVIDGLSNKEIALRLTVTPGTVKWYVNQIFAKLHVRSRVQAIVRARELNLIGGTVIMLSTDRTSSLSNLPEPENPYKGLRAFSAADEQDFFGRDDLIKQLLAKMSGVGTQNPASTHKHPTESRFLAVLGPSGSGKSSLVKAGLIPALWRGELPGSEKWFIVEMLPGTHPLEKLEMALIRVAANQSSHLHEQLKRDKRGLLRAADLILPNDGTELVIVIDQFEEVFTLVENEADRQHFLNLVCEAIIDARSRVRIMITLRADFYDRPLNYPEFGELLRNHMETVLPLSAKGLERAIAGPAERVGVRFETGLVAAIVSEMNYQAGALPLMQYALTELFERREGRKLTHQAYQEIGGAVGALAKRAEEVFRELTSEAQEVARQMFLRLVTLGEGTEDTRRRTARTELLSIVSDADLMDEIIDTYVEYRLLTLDTDSNTRTPTVEVAHEAILREWERLRNWLNESRADIRQQRLLSYASGEWKDNKQDTSFLLTGSRLEQFEMWIGETQLALTSLEREFLTASLSERAKQKALDQERQAREVALEKRSVRTLRGLVTVMAIATIIAVTLAGIALRNEATAERNAEISQSLALASAARAASSDGNGEQSIALAVAANEITEPPIFAQRTLYEIALAPGTQSIVNGGEGWRWAAEISPNSRMLAVYEDAVRIALWDINTREVLIRLDGGHTDGLGGLDFTPDSKRLLVGAWDDSLELWDLNTGEIIWKSVNPAGDPNSVVISSDGLIAIVGSERGVATLWNVQTGEYVGELVGHDPAVQVLGTAFSPNDRFVATASEDATVIIWNVETRKPLHRLKEHTAIVFSVSFSPDGRTLASSGFDNSIILWDVETGEMIHRLVGHTDFVFDVDWSSDGSRLLSASRDSTLILWNATDGTRLHTYRDEAGRSFTVSFIDDKRAVSGGSSSNVRFWSLFDEREQMRIDLPDEPIYSMALSQDEQTAALGTQNAIVLIDLKTGEKVKQFSYEARQVTSIAFAPDGKSVIAGFEDNSIIRWDIESGGEVRRFEGHSSIVVNEDVQFRKILSLAVSPDGQYMVSGAEDKTMIVWDVDSGEVMHRVENCSGTINTGVFSPDGHYIAGGFGALSEPTRGICPENDLSIHLWDAKTGDLIRQFEGHSDAVTTVQFCREGQRLISGSIDETIRLWDVQSGAELRQFDGHSGGVMSVDCDSTGQYIASGASDGTLRVWDSETGDLLRQMTGHTGQINHVQFVNGTSAIWSSSDDGSLRLWQPVLDFDDLQKWVSINRYVRELTCSERELYRIEPLCEETDS